ncbi:MAG: lyase family protein, partial [Actinomycetota bacterium]
GTSASLGADGVAVMGLLADELGLPVPAMPWHTDRTRIAELAGALGVAAGAVAKPARDIVLLAQTEVGEVRERTSGRGGSSTLPQKRNPIAAVAAAGCAATAPGLVATLLSSMVQEHERAAGAWHAEWKPLADLVTAVGSAAVWLRECLSDLEVDEARMRSNLDLTGGLLLAERIVAALAPTLGRLAAHDLVEEACRQAVEGNRALADVLAEHREVSAQLSPGEIADLLDPLAYLGSADAFVERALEAHRAAPGTDAP